MKHEIAKRRAEIRKLAIQTLSRTDIERTWKNARKEYAKAKAEYDHATTQVNHWQAKATEAQRKMAQSRQTIVDMSNFVQTMDLTGANSIKDRGDLKTYLIDGKEFHVDDSDLNDIKFTPYKKYRDEKENQEIEVPELFDAKI